MVRKRPLRATRRSAPILPTSEQQQEQEEGKSQPRRRQARGATKRKYAEVEEDVSSLSESSADEEEQPREKPARKKARGTAAKKRKGNKTTADRRGPASARTCPHCNKVFSIKEGLQYHVDHKVCQRKKQEKKQTATPKKGAKKRKGSKTTTDRRGPASARTCPHCNKVFSIKEGLQYHVDQKVCQRKNQEKKQTASPKKGGKKQGGGPQKCPRCNKKFAVLAGLAYHLDHNVCQKDTKARSPSSTSDALLPGARFVTPYGVVQVVADNRQTEAVVAIAEKPSVKQRNVASAAKAKSDTRRKKNMMNLAIRMRMRRAKLMRLYNNKSTNMIQADLWKAYFGKDPTKLTDEERKNWIPQGKKDTGDSTTVPDSSPLDRIVECILVPDERQKIYDLDDYEPLNSWDAAKASVLRAQKEAAASRGKTDSKESSSSVSPYCGMRLFLKRQLLMQPYSPDMRVFVCGDCNREFSSREGYSYHVRSQVCTRKAKARKEQARQEREDVQARSERSLSRSERSLNRMKERGKQRSKRRLDQCAMYPQVMLALGYRLLPKTHENSTAFSVGATTEEEKPEEATDTGPDLVDPQIVLDELQAELQETEMALSKTQPLLTKRQMKKKIKPKKKKPKPKQPKKVVTVVDKKPLPPIIDTRVLVDEVDAGRYPSMKRYNGEHSDACVNCKEGGNMYCCDFCNNVEHFECIRAKLTVKEPEPKDDFMCHKCIQYILARRARAEKRRQLKQSAVLGSNETSQAASTETTGSEMNEENEYDRAAKIGREMNELVELLQDARTRLHLAAETTTVNNIRRSLLDPC